MPYEVSYEAYDATEQVRVYSRGALWESAGLQPGARSRRSSAGLAIEGQGRPGNRAEDSCRNEHWREALQAKMQGAQRSLIRRDAATGRLEAEPSSVDEREPQGGTTCLQCAVHLLTDSR
jgi:hypothetical protein